MQDFLSILREQTYLVLGSWAFYTCTSGLVRHFSPRLFPSIYAHVGKQGKSAVHRLHITWSHHVVSQLNALVLCAFSLYLMARDCSEEFLEAKDRLWKGDSLTAGLSAISLGYFLWDAKVCVHYWALYGPSFMIHALMAIVATVATIGQFGQYYAPKIMIYEVTTLFMNAHWFMEKFPGWSGSRLQLANDILVVVLYGLVRVVYGTYNIVFGVFRDCLLEHVPWPLFLLTLSTMGSSLILNFYWFYLLLSKALEVLTASPNDAGQDGSKHETHHLLNPHGLEDTVEGSIVNVASESSSSSMRSRSVSLSSSSFSTQKSLASEKGAEAFGEGSSLVQNEKFVRRLPTPS